MGILMLVISVALDSDGACLAREKTRRLLANRPCSSFVYLESYSKERLRVSNWIVRRLYNYAVKIRIDASLTNAR